MLNVVSSPPSGDDSVHGFRKAALKKKKGLKRDFREIYSAFLFFLQCFIYELVHIKDPESKGHKSALTEVPIPHRKHPPERPPPLPSL